MQGRPRSPHGRSGQTRRDWLVRQAGRALAVAWPLGAGCQAPLPPLRVGSLVFPGHELLFLARESGWLDPARVRLIEMRSNTDTLRALGAGQLEAAQLTLDEALQARARGLDLRIIHVLDVSVGADAVLARPGLRDPRQLRGRRVGVEDSAGGAIVLGAFLAAAGLRVGDIVKVPMTLDQTRDFYRSGEVDAVVTAEPWIAHLEAEGAVRLFDSRAIPGRIVDVLVARADAIALHAAGFQHLVDAHSRALQAWRRAPGPDQAPARLMAPRLQMAPADVPLVFRGLLLPSREEARTMLAPDGLITRTARDLLAVMAADGLATVPWSWADAVEPRFVQAPWSG